MKAQHIHDAHRWETRGEQFGALCHDSTDQQATVTSALDGEFFRSGVAVVSQSFCRRDEVIEHVLLI